MKQIFYVRRNAGTRGERRGLPLPSRLVKRRYLPQRGAGQNPATSAFLAHFGVRKLVKRKCNFFARRKAKNWHFHMQTNDASWCMHCTDRQDQ